MCLHPPFFHPLQVFSTQVFKASTPAVLCSTGMQLVGWYIFTFWEEPLVKSLHLLGCMCMVFGFFIYLDFFEGYVITSEFYSKEVQIAASHAGVFDWIRRLDPVWRYGGFMQN